MKTNMTISPLEPLQVDMDPVRLAATCLAISAQNAVLREENAALRRQEASWCALARAADEVMQPEQRLAAAERAAELYEKGGAS